MELELIRQLQSIATPALDLLFQLLTMLGEPVPSVLIFLGLYWTVDREAGEFLGYCLCSSLLLGNAVKDIVQAPRPIGEEGVRSLRVHTATGHSFPSGHTQSAATLYTGLGMYLKRRGPQIAFALLILLVGLSRVYLGVHYPKDVLAGLALGVLVPFLARWLLARVPRQRLYLFTALAFLPILLISPGHDFYVATGCMLGFLIAMPLVHRRLPFRTDVPRHAKLLRLLLGSLMVGGCHLLLKILLPSGEGMTVLRYAATISFALAGCPWLFLQFPHVFGGGTKTQK